MIDLRDDGTTVIDFPNGPVTIRQPKWGAYKRLRVEQERMGQHVRDAIDAFPVLDPLPDPDDESDEAKAKRKELTPLYLRRVREVEELVSESLVTIWRLILIGTEDFQPLADPVPSDNPDEWPTELLIDAPEYEMIDGQRTRTNEAFIEQWFRHVGKVSRSRSGPTLSAVPS